LIIAYRADGAQPWTINLDYNASGADSVLSFVKVSADGKIKLTSEFAGADVIVDVEGWVTAPSASAQVYTPTDPTRIVNTTSGQGACTPSCARLATNTTSTIQIAGQGPAPPNGAGAVLVNFTAVNGSAAGTVQAYASDAA
jgi:hypothetical protein